MVRLLAKLSDSMSNVNLGGFRSQLQALYASSHTVCGWLYIYIYCHQKLGCFVEPKLFSVARLKGYFKLRTQNRFILRHSYTLSLTSRQSQRKRRDFLSIYSYVRDWLLECFISRLISIYKSLYILSSFDHSIDRSAFVLAYSVGTQAKEDTLKIVLDMILKYLIVKLSGE